MGYAPSPMVVINVPGTPTPATLRRVEASSGVFVSDIVGQDTQEEERKGEGGL